MLRRRRSWPSTLRRLLFDVVTLAGFAVRSRSQLVAENLFLRKQLALYQERRVSVANSYFLSVSWISPAC